MFPTNPIPLEVIISQFNAEDCHKPYAYIDLNDFSESLAQQIADKSCITNDERPIFSIKDCHLTLTSEYDMNGMIDGSGGLVTFKNQLCMDVEVDVIKRKIQVKFIKFERHPFDVEINEERSVSYWDHYECEKIAPVDKSGCINLEDDGILEFICKKIKSQIPKNQVRDLIRDFLNDSELLMNTVEQLVFPHR